MNRIIIYCLMILSFFTFSVNAFAGVLKAFPGAEGFGALAEGGRGGRVIHVTNLNSEGPGSLRAACESDGRRIVVFDVAGVIRGDIPIRASSITIAGQSAPEPGITLEGMLFSWPYKEDERLHDIVVRFLRIRPGPTTGHNGDAVQLPNTEKVILDHMSLSWANDEIIDIIYSSEVTIQWTTIEESDPSGHGKGVPHNFAILSAYKHSGNISIHHNLFANHSRRIPSLTPETMGKHADFRNNVIYNFREGLGHDGHTPKAGINIIGNYYKRGPDAWFIMPFNFIDAGEYYLEGNYIEDAGYVNETGNIFPLWLKSNLKGSRLEMPVPVAEVKTEAAMDAYEHVLNYAGTFPRDRITLRTLNEVREGKGSWLRNAPAHPDDKWYLHGMPGEAGIVDTDKDGMPDEWEKKKGLDNGNGSDHNTVMHSGYTAIEEYLNDRAAELLAKYSQ